MKKFIISGAALVALAVPSVAGAEYSPPSQIPTHAQCGTEAGSGGFGALAGKDVNRAGGADSVYFGADSGQHKGELNSTICGR